MGIKLPEPFLEKMKRLLGTEYEQWLNTYNRKRLYGLRVNTLKIETGDFLAVSPFAGLAPITWCREGFYYEEEDRPGKHPYYHAGLYYIQEPSAMVPGELLGVEPGDRVLDLCAAPGGKSTQLAAKLKGQGLLVANDNARERTKALAKNIELAGVRNAVVLNEDPERLIPYFRGFFTKILVDAPCSGEGMFRKDESMIAAWEKHSVERCTIMQRDILRHAAELLAPGGLLLYSTCTFSPEENEAQIARLLDSRKDMEIVPVEPQFGWSPGRPDWAEEFPGVNAAQMDADQEVQQLRAEQALAGTVRLWPHKLAGEGHYAALLRKRRTEATDEPQAETNQRIDQGDSTVSAAVKPHVKDKSAQLASGTLRRVDKGSGEHNSRRDKKRPDNQGQESGRKDNRGKHGPAAASDTDVMSMWKEFAAVNVPDAEQWPGILRVYGRRLYLQPAGLPELSGLRIVREGWYLGEAGTRRFEPSQALAMGLRSEEAARYLGLTDSTGEALRYLKGETLHIDRERIVVGADKEVSAPASSYVLVGINGFPLGWGKWGDGMLKNGLSPGWRWMG
ncbi:RsmB/NOP family class I SAM-dependent RNA methyltransferase [Paenibacillus tarimensis]|uniref:RsmB/NOP family class I SAM-dependent RNA methyltransferase n=1 Tax=Paenibacillus tarimensis TaxID=416012 RepID=UPI001F352502|nr:RsmF rRNA methyltransferase first C-terminal domain-containing protein [Paenibacillus tarimensis]MCF2943251.1 RsmF rRNA methyltransferase first C-terminal domain-containing protein [Paenibacillus tarimensis]